MSRTDETEAKVEKAVADLEKAAADLNRVIADLKDDGGPKTRGLSNPGK